MWEFNKDLVHRNISHVPDKQQQLLEIILKNEELSRKKT